MDLDCFFDLGGFESSMNINDHQSSMIIYIYIYLNYHKKNMWGLAGDSWCQTALHASRIFPAFRKTSDEALFQVFEALEELAAIVLADSCKDLVCT